MSEYQDAIRAARRFSRVEASRLMADHFADFHRVVTAMLIAYEANPALNDDQPEEAAACYAMSLDEWAVQIGAAREVWEARAAEVWTPCVFTFDYEGAPALQGQLSERTWNGWPIVRVTGAVRLDIAKRFLISEDDAECVGDLLSAEADADGFYTLDGFCPEILSTGADASPLQVEGEGWGPMTLAQFFAENGEGLEAVQRADIAATIGRGEVYRGGGGAAGEFEVRPAKVEA